MNRLALHNNNPDLITLAENPFMKKEKDMLTKEKILNMFGASTQGTEKGQKAKFLSFNASAGKLNDTGISLSADATRNENQSL